MARMFIRRRRRSSHTLPEITLTPLIDTALTLLIIFMVTSPMLNNAVRVDLPKGSVKEDVGLQEDVIVHLAKSNTRAEKEVQLFVNGQAVKQDQLVSQVKKKLGNQKHKTVYVKGDKTIQYGSLMEVVDQIKQVEGIDRVALATQKA